jgi:hypothetical protein
MLKMCTQIHFTTGLNMRLLLTVLVIITASCSWLRSEPKDDPDFDRYKELRAARQLWLMDLHGMRDPQTTWPANDCDAWIWTGKAVAAGAMGIELARSEYPGRPGSYGRRPPNPKWCWQDGQNHGSSSTWSRDMFKCGMLIYALTLGDRDMLERHQAFGQENGWRMGDPPGSDRVFYTPAIRGHLARAIKKLGGAHDDDALIPDIYPGGMTDYQAHLQMCGIWATGLIEGGLMPGQLKRIEEHYARTPTTVFYAFMHGRWISGDLDPVADALIANPPVAGDYVRCGDSEPACQLAEKAWVASLILELQ